MKRVFFVSTSIVVFLILSIGVMASFDVELSEEEACMVTPHRFELNVTNRQGFEDIFYVKAIGTYRKWAWVSNSVLILKPGESETSEISVLPPKTAEMGKYNLEALIYSSRNRSVERTKDLCFIIFRNYSMQVSNFSLSRTSYDPEEVVKTSITVWNDGSKDFKNINFSVEARRNGDLIGSSTRNFGLDLEEKKRVTASIPLGRYQEPGNYELSYKVVARGSVFSAGITTFEVNPIQKKSRNKTVKRDLLGSTSKIRIKNLGNTRYESVIQKKVGYPAAFLITAPDAEVRRVGMSSSYSWTVEIEPRQSKTVQYRVNYWPIYILLAIIAFLIYRAYRYLQVPVIRKEVMKTELSEDERIYTISLEIVNRLFGEAKNVVVGDAVPSVARVIQEFDTLEPAITKGEEETKLRWDLGQISSGEERVLHYKVKTLVEAVDYLRLPEAWVKGSVDGREFERKSSKVKLEV